MVSTADFRAGTHMYPIGIATERHNASFPQTLVPARWLDGSTLLPVFMDFVCNNYTVALPPPGQGKAVLVGTVDFSTPALIVPPPTGRLSLFASFSTMNCALGNASRFGEAAIGLELRLRGKVIARRGSLRSCIAQYVALTLLESIVSVKKPR